MAVKGTESLWNDAQAFRLEVRMARVQVASLGEEELASALAYEVEPFSKIPASEAEIVWREAGGHDASMLVFETVERRLGRRRVKETGDGKGKGAQDQLLKYALAIGAIVVLLIACDWAYLGWKVRTLGCAVAQQRPLDAEIKRIEAAARTVQAEAAELRGRREAAISAQDRVERLRAAFPSLMDAVAKVCGGKTVVRSFETADSFEIEMRAVASSAQAAAIVMADLAKAAEAIGWSLEPGTIVAAPNGATVEFSCRMNYEL